MVTYLGNWAALSFRSGRGPAAHPRTILPMTASAEDRTELNRQAWVRTASAHVFVAYVYRAVVPPVWGQRGRSV